MLPSSSSNTVNDFATSGTDLAQRLSKLSDEINGIVQDVKDGKGTVGRLFSDEALYNNLNATIRETEDVMKEIRSGKVRPDGSSTIPRFTTTPTRSRFQMQRLPTICAPAAAPLARFHRRRVLQSHQSHG